MDKEQEIETFDRLNKIENRLSVLEEKVRNLVKDASLDFSVLQTEPDSDEPIIDG